MLTRYSSEITNASRAAGSSALRFTNMNAFEISSIFDIDQAD
jgi:hypothetical protein